MSTTDAPAARPSIDWPAIHERLAKAALVLEQGTELSPAGQQQILEERARLLAREAEADEVDGQIDLVEFLLAYERYAIESAWVSEIHPLKEITPLPGTPDFVLGLIHLRGQIVSVIDLKRVFGLPSRGLPDLNRVIVVGNGAVEFGILADSVTGMRRVPSRDLQPALPTLTGIRAEYLKGVTPDRMVVLDAARLLADPKIRVCQTEKE